MRLPGIERVIARLREHLAALLAGAKVDQAGRLVTDALNAELAAKLQASLSGVLADLGYDGAIGKLVTSFEDLAAESDAALQDTLGASLSSASHPSLSAFVSGVVDDLLAVKGLAGERLREAMILATQTNAPLDKAIAALADAVGGTLSQATTLADTSLMAFHREILVSESEDAGIDLFVYLGPDDAVTRPFCQEHVDKVYTPGDLDDEDNEQGLAPTSRYLGGFNCRHYLSPITAEEARTMPAAMIGGSEARRIVLRGGTGDNEAAFVSANIGKVIGNKVVRRRALAG